MKETLFEQKLSKDYSRVESLGDQELIQEIEAFFENIADYGYPDPDRLIVAGSIASLTGERLNPWVLAEWGRSNTIFKKARLLWFLTGFWKKRTSYALKEIELLLSLKINESDFGVQEACIYLLHIMWCNVTGEVKRQAESLIRYLYQINKITRTYHSLIDDIIEKDFPL